MMHRCVSTSTRRNQEAAAKASTWFLRFDDRRSVTDPSSRAASSAIHLAARRITVGSVPCWQFSCHAAVVMTDPDAAVALMARTVFPLYPSPLPTVNHPLKIHDYHSTIRAPTNAR